MKLLAVAGGGTIAVALILGFLLWGGPSPDELQPGLRLFSPDGSYVASFYGTVGGGAAGWSYQYVAIARSDASFDPNDYILRMRRGYQVCIRWTRDTALLLEVPAEAVIDVEQSTVDIGGRIDIEVDRRSSEYGMLVPNDCSGSLATLGAVGDPWKTEGQPVVSQSRQ